MLLLFVVDSVVLVISILLALVAGLGVGFYIRVRIHEKNLKNSREEARKIVEKGKEDADKAKRDSIFEAKQEIHQLKKENERDVKERQKIIIELEEKATQRENALNQRTVNLDRREESLDQREGRLNQKKEQLEQLNSEVEKVLEQQEAKLIEIAGISVNDAQKVIMDRVKDQMAQEITLYIRDEEEKAKIEVVNKAKSLLSLAIQKYASEMTTERTVSVVDIPSDEMKGRIIGREGRNIRTLEAATGVDLIIDDTPLAVVLSGFDPVRREIAKKALETLIADGRIHPARIEEVVEKSRLEVDIYIRESGEEAVFKAGIGRIHPDIIKLLGRLKFRTSYGQNVLKHSLETAFLAGKLAAELGENEVLAKRAGLLHDIGKAVDHEVEGSHVEIGVNIATRYKEPKEVIDAIASHHGDKDPDSIIAVLVSASDALSAARPGARNESVENYAKRLEQLEELSNDVKGVEKSFAIQAGREIRVIVRPDEVDDSSMFAIAREIKEKIEKNLSYPGTVKITVIRETRATDVAK